MKRLAPAGLAGLLALGLFVGTSSAHASTTSGSLDPTFGNGGKVLTNLGVEALPSDAVLLSNGDIVVSGNFGVVRYLSNGSLDQTFGKAGLAATAFNDTGLGPTGLAIQPDGKIVWVGNTSKSVAGGEITDFAVERYNANGSPDTSFGSGGMVTTEFFGPAAAGALEVADAAVIQTDGKIVVGGSATQGQIRLAPQQTALARYNPDGSLDPSFGRGGKALSSPGGARTIGLDAAGDIFVLPAEAEFSPAGQPNSGVTPATITTSSHGGPDLFLASGQSVQGLAIGVAKHDVDAQVRRFNAGGSLDATFASPAIDYSGLDGQASDGVGAVAVQPNGQAVVGGAHFSSTSVFGLARVNTNGSLDATFGNGGTLTTTFHGDEAVAALIVQPDGKLVAIGMSENNTTGEVDVALARYLG